MAWVTPKTNWTEDDYFNASDYNRIKDNVLALYGLMPSSAWSDDPSGLVVMNYEYTDTSSTVSYGDHIYDLRNYSFISGYDITDGRGIFSWDITLRDGTNKHIEFRSVDGILTTESFIVFNVASCTYHWVQTQMCDYFDIADMGSEKLVNDLLYARELNTVLDNLELIGSNIGLPFDERPYYSADGSMPDADELNLIEEYELLLYNRINGITE